MDHQTRTDGSRLDIFIHNEQCQEFGSHTHIQQLIFPCTRTGFFYYKKPLTTRVRMGANTQFKGPVSNRGRNRGRGNRVRERRREREIRRLRSREELNMLLTSCHDCQQTLPVWYNLDNIGNQKASAILGKSQKYFYSELHI